MASFFRKLKSFLEFSGDHSERKPDVDDILGMVGRKLRQINPDTPNQWMHLQRTIAGNDAGVLERKARFSPRLVFATVFVAVVSAGLYIYLSNTKVSPEIIVTGRGEQKEVILKDGSEVVVSYASELVSFGFELNQPRRVLLKGEAYFRVRKSEVPFIVSTEYADIRVVGTEFNVHAREDELEVAVIQGSVRVNAVRDGRDSTLLLTQHEAAAVNKSGFPRRLNDIPSVDYPGWMHGKLFLRKTSLAAACREIEMRFDVAVAIDETVGEPGAITGVLDAPSAEHAIAALCELIGRKYTRESSAYHIF